MENNFQSKRKKIIMIVIIITLIIVLGITVWFARNNFITLFSKNADERYINDSNSTGQGLKVIFIDAMTGKRIRNKKVMVDVFNGRMCINGGCDSYDIFAKGKTDKNGVAFIDFSHWPKKTNGHIILDDWDCDSSISDSSNDAHAFFTENTKKLLFECVNNKYKGKLSKKLKLLNTFNEELINTPVMVDFENCRKEECKDLNDITVETNLLGNLFIPYNYIYSDVSLLMEGYKPIEVEKFKYPYTLYFIKQGVSLGRGSTDDKMIADLKQLQNAVEFYFSENEKYPIPASWEDLTRQLYKYDQNLPMSFKFDPEVAHYTYATNDNGDQYCLLASLLRNNDILKTDIDSNYCNISQNSWRAVGTGNERTNCEDGNYQFSLCLGN